MRESTKEALILTVYAAWIGAFGIGLAQIRRNFVELSRRVQQTDRMTQNLIQDSAQIKASIRAMHSNSTKIEFLEGLVSVLPKSKSFVRTQQAMADEVDILRSKVGRRIKND